MLRIFEGFRKDPLRLFGALWPIALVTPYLPWLPRPMLGGYPWRQEIVVAILLTLTFGLLLSPTAPRHRSVIRWSRPEILLLLPSVLFAAWVAASATWAIYPPAAVYQAFHWIAYILFLWIMFAVAGRLRALRATFVALGVVIWILSAACFIGFWGAPTDMQSPAGSLFRYFSGFGEMMCVAVPIFAALALYLRQPRTALFCGVTALLAWISTIEALERAPIIGAAAGMVMLAAGISFKENCRPRHRSRVQILFASFILVTTIQAVSSLVARQKTSAMARLESTSLSEPNTRVRFLFWGIALEMLRAHPFIGVGASNYEIAYAEARSRFSSTHPNSPLIALHEEMLVQFAHNEYIQVLAESGIIGLSLLFLLFLSIAAALRLALSRSKMPLPALGAGGGILAFALSSAASTCSFQWMGGGLMFFFAVALVTTACRKQSGVEAALASNTTGPVGLGSALAWSVLLVGAWGVRAGNAILLGSAETSRDPSRAEQSYRSAIQWDPRDSSTRYSYGAWLYSRGRPEEAVPFLSYGVDHGLNTSLCYSDLAAAETEAGNAPAAEATLADATRVYPRSVFLRVRHATALAEAGRPEEAEKEYRVALTLDSRVARGWWQLINFGFYASRDAAQKDSNIARAGELYPENCILTAIAQYKRHAPSAYPQDVIPRTTPADWPSRLRN